MPATLLGPKDPNPVLVQQPEGRSAFMIVCDHSGRVIPQYLKNLGLPDAELERHIAWDIGVFEVAKELGRKLDACTIHQNYSRLVIDCNRHPLSNSSIPDLSETTKIPGNHQIGRAQRAARINEIFWPYHDQISEVLNRRCAEQQPVVVIALHSFTPVFKGQSRPWDVSVLYDRESRLALKLKSLLDAEGKLIVGDNQPYIVDELNDYTVPIHCERRALPYVEIEIRQDLISNLGDQQNWALRLARILPQAYRQISSVGI
jgi:predicted N-formylglutamate amidohydrolase